MPCTEHNTEPMIDDSGVPTVFFDGLANVENRNGVLRMTAYVRKLDPFGQTVRIPVAIFVRPSENTMEIRRAVMGATAETALMQFTH